MDAPGVSSDGSRWISAEEFYASPDPLDFRRELIEGVVVNKPFRCMRDSVVCSQVSYFLYEATRSTGLGAVLGPGCGFVIARDPDTVVAPGGAFIDRGRLDRLGVDKFYFREAPTLAIEVVSPSDQEAEVREKAKMWIESGCEAVWLVWPSDQTVTVYRSLDNIRVLTAEQTLEGEDVVPGFSIKVAELFAGLK